LNPDYTGAFLLFKMVHKPLSPTNRYCGSFQGVYWSGPAVDHSHPSSADVKDGGIE